MRKSILSIARPRAVALATFGTLSVLTMTAIHHVYGAILFATPWRLHIVYISIPVALAILALIPIGRASPAAFVSRVASWTYLALSIAFAIGAIGIYEGGYNHLLPNVQYMLGVESTLRRDLYVPPDDLLFQVTGIGQFALAAFAAYHLWLLCRTPEHGGDTP